MAIEEKENIEEPPEVEQESLQPEWENPPTIRDLQQNLDDADVDHGNHQQDVNRWLDNMAMEGAAAPPKVKGRSSVAPKVIRKQAEWRYSSLSDPFLSSSDIFEVSPKTAGDRTRAQQNGLVLNHQLNTYINKVAFIDAYVRDAVDTGTVICEVSWVIEEEEVPEEVPVYEYQPSMDPQLGQRYIHLAQIKQASQDLYWEHMNEGTDQAIGMYIQTGQLYEAVQVGTEIKTSIVETKNHPYVEVCDSANILIDPSCGGDLNKAQFVIKRHKASLSDLKKEGKYENLDKILVDSASVLANPDFKDTDDIQSFSFNDKPRKQFVVTTYWGSWDIHKTGIVVPIVASWVNSTLIRLEENPYPFKKPPFVMAVYMPKRRSIYGEPDGELLEDNQKIIGATTRGLIDLMGKSANAQMGTKQGFLDATNKRRFARGDNYEFNAQGDPRHAIYQHSFPELPRSGFDMIQMQNADAESLTGVKAFNSGINSAALGDSVGGGRDAMDAASKRESGILNRLAEGIREIGRMFVAMNAVWLSDEEVVRITDDEFVTVRRDDLAGNFDIKLGISTAEENNKRAQELAFMLQTLGNNMDFDLQKILISDIARLRKMPAVAKRVEEFEPKPDPMEVMKAQLEIKLLEAQIEKELELAAKHRSEAEANKARGYKDGTQGDLNSAKAGTEGAKTREHHSNADKTDLDYIHKTTGVDHARDLQKQDKKDLNDLNKTIVQAGLTNNEKKE